MLFGSPLCGRGENLGTELWALAGKGSIDDE
ncbi:citrate synthase [Escherichia coli TW10509]|nr:citrate synthase [Escherichia coli TW10509]